MLPPTPFPYKVPPLVTYLIASVSAITGLFVTQGLITNQQEKLYGAIASIVIPTLWMLGSLVYNAWTHHSEAKVISAQFAASAQSGTQAIPPPAVADRGASVIT